MLIKAKGFTLIELLVTIAIIGIVAAIAMPAYQNSVIKSRRADAKVALTSLAALQERRYSLQNNYAKLIGDLDGGFSTSPEGYYTITLNQTACSDDGTCYLFTATPTGSQADDTECANFTLNHVGARGETGTGSVTDCW